MMHEKENESKLIQSMHKRKTDLMKKQYNQNYIVEHI